jgi:C-methyltransferase C-terminal domain/Putative zinc binding domain/Methyltransferase domain
MTERLCRFCRTPLSRTFADLGVSPIANAFLTPTLLNKMEPFYPLHAYVCEACMLVQLEDFETPERIFNDQYAYFSSYSDSWLDHARRYTELVAARLGLNANSFVVEIASNDGYLLQYFVQKGIPVLGIEPSGNVASVAQAKGIDTWVEFLTANSAQELVSKRRRADLIVGNNVLAHVPALNDFVEGLKILLSEHGVITMEFPHLLCLMRENQFDTIYHEHFSYFSFLAVEQIFAKHGLRIFDVDQLSTHGGSLRIYAAHESSKRWEEQDSVRKLLAEERRAGLNDVSSYSNFSERVNKTKLDLLRFLIDLKYAGKKVVGYGAPAKGNTLLNFCGIRSDLIDFTVDRSPQKQGMFLPGTHIPIVAPERIFETKPDYVLILPWNLRDEIVSQMSGIAAWGGKFVVPIPQVRVLG